MLCHVVLESAHRRLPLKVAVEGAEFREGFLDDVDAIDEGYIGERI